MAPDSWLQQTLAQGDEARPEPDAALICSQVLAQIRRLGGEARPPASPELPPVRLQAEILLPCVAPHRVGQLHVGLELSHDGCDVLLTTAHESIYDVLAPQADDLARRLGRTLTCPACVRVVLDSRLPADAS